MKGIKVALVCAHCMPSTVPSTLKTLCFIRKRDIVIILSYSCENWGLESLVDDPGLCS